MKKDQIMHHEHPSSMSTMATPSVEPAAGTRLPLAVSACPSSEELNDPHWSAAVRQIMTAFVEVGFGVSAAQHALTAANKNRRLQTLAEDFCRDAG
ncbi:hypothetical protein ACW9UM_00335 [Marinovum sp. KMM 9989]